VGEKGRETMMSKSLDIAKKYHARGWHPVAIAHGKKGPTDKEWNKREFTEDTLPQYFNGAAQNIGVQLGARSRGLTDIDLDCPEAIKLARYFLPKTNSIFGRASKPRSHLLYYIDDPIDKASLKLTGVDKSCIVELRMGGGAKGAQTVFPGSTHPSGEAIEWVQDDEPTITKFATLKTAVTKIAAATILIRAMPAVGTRHDAALALGGFLARAGWEVNDVGAFAETVWWAADLKEAAEEAKTAAIDSAKKYQSGEKEVFGLPGLAEFFGEAAAKKIAKLLEYGDGGDGDLEVDDQQDDQSENTAPSFSEEHLALHFSHLHADDLRFVAVWNKWYYFDGQRWKVDETKKTFSLARNLCRKAAMKVNKPREAKAIASAKTRAAVVALAGEDRRQAATVDQWDADPWLLNTPDGVIDLRTGERRDHRGADYMTKITSVGPNSDCPTPLWTAFLDKVTGGDKKLQAFLQRISGYSLTGSTREHALAFLYGTGRNGKGVFTNALIGIMGDYHCAAPIETFTESNSDRHPTDLAMLRGARLVTSTETEEGRRWAESRIKMLTGGDKVSARFMRQDFFAYVPRFKLMISGNHKPGLRSVDEAIKARFNLIPFAVTIPPEERDKELGNKLVTEYPGILQWMIEGCLQWQAIGLSQPEAVTDATSHYLDNEDAIKLWLEECCNIDPNYWTATGILFERWEAWAKARGEFVGSARRFSQRLETEGFAPARKWGRGFAGLTVYRKPDDQSNGEFIWTGA
jgi:putative DNA primase/helicase